MITEKRTIQVEQEVYIARDGKEFTDDWECRRYEYDLVQKTLKFYNSKLEPSVLDECSWVVLNSVDDIINLIELCEYDGITRKGLTKAPGIYYYDGDHDAWINVTQAIDLIRIKEAS